LYIRKLSKINFPLRKKGHRMLKSKS